MKDGTIDSIKVDGKRRKLATPLSVNIIPDDTVGFIAVCEDLILFGTGRTKIQAIKDLRSIVSHFYEYYRDIEEDKLIGQAILQKRYYENLLEEDND